MPSSNVIELTSADFKGTTLSKYKDKVVLIKFYAPWCGYCIKSAPGYQELSIKYKNDKKVIIAQIDCDKYEDFINEFNQFATGPKVLGYPTFLLYVNGLYKETYNGPREVSGYMDILNKYY